LDFAYISRVSSTLPWCEFSGNSSHLFIALSLEYSAEVKKYTEDHKFMIYDRISAWPFPAKAIEFFKYSLSHPDEFTGYVPAIPNLLELCSFITQCLELYVEMEDHSAFLGNLYQLRVMRNTFRACLERSKILRGSE
jgi:hypothetical protein